MQFSFELVFKEEFLIKSEVSCKIFWEWIERITDIIEETYLNLQIFLMLDKILESLRKDEGVFLLPKS